VKMARELRGFLRQLRARARRYQSEKCGQVVGSCLGNQLFDLKQADDKRVAQGMAPRYSVSRYLNGGTNTVRINASQALNRVQLELPVDQISTSLMTLEVAADSLRFVVNASPGKARARPPVCLRALLWYCKRGQCASSVRNDSGGLGVHEHLHTCCSHAPGESCAALVQILSARVCNQNGTVCDTAAALNSVVLVAVVAQNVGAIDADYTATLGNCTYATQQVPAQSLSLAAGAQDSVVFQVRCLRTLCCELGHCPLRHPAAFGC
jgi:Male gamete fusion factor